jgi:hypothetical protein
MFKNYYLGSYKDFSSDVGPIILCIGMHGENLVGLELGVYKADSLMTILENCPNVKTLYGVDNYSTYYNAYERREIEKYESEMIKAESLLKQKYSSHRDKIKFLEYASIDAATKIEDESLDFIFIDANHSYNSVLEDLNLWYPKVKQGGLVAGHDFHMESVREAVNDFRTKMSISCYMSDYLSCYIWKK